VVKLHRRFSFCRCLHCLSAFAAFAANASWFGTISRHQSVSVSIAFRRSPRSRLAGDGLTVPNGTHVSIAFRRSPRSRLRNGNAITLTRWCYAVSIAFRRSPRSRLVEACRICREEMRVSIAFRRSPRSRLDTVRPHGVRSEKLVSIAFRRSPRSRRRIMLQPFQTKTLSPLPFGVRRVRGSGHVTPCGGGTQEGSRSGARNCCGPMYAPRDLPARCRSRMRLVPNGLQFRSGPSCFFPFRPPDLGRMLDLIIRGNRRFSHCRPWCRR
jgi:hypothetical protein